MKMFKGLKMSLLIGLMMFSMSACGENDRMISEPESKIESLSEIASESGGKNDLGYERITVKEARNLMDIETDYIIIDARTEEEFLQGHIPEAILIPEYEIADRAEKELPDKGQLILVYCRSGRRSKIASLTLADLGYTNVKEFGGIIDWPYEIVK